MIKEHTHTVNSYEKELESLTNFVVEMGKIVLSILETTMKSIKTFEPHHLELAKNTDKEINKLDDEIEKRAVTLIALRQPMAIDLRIVISSLRLAVILERMGDLAKNSVKRVAYLKANIDPEVISSTDLMASIIFSMLDQMLVCYKSRDLAKSLEISERDDEVDFLYKKIIELIEKNLAEKPHEISDYIQFLYAVKNLERIGDYASKFSKHIHYIVTGEKAPKLKKDKNSSI